LQQTQSPTPSPAATQADASTSTQAAPPAATDPTGASATPSTSATVPQPIAAPAVAHSVPPGANGRPQNPVVKPAVVTTEAPPPQTATQLSAPDNRAVPPAESKPAPAAPDNSAEISELRDRKAGMDSRIAAVRESLDNIRRSQAQSGLSLRGDMASAEQRMFYQMNEADASLRNSDPQSARKHLDSAEADLNKLESFLGR
jgi:hypothetical protein